MAWEVKGHEPKVMHFNPWKGQGHPRKIEKGSTPRRGAPERQNPSRGSRWTPESPAHHPEVRLQGAKAKALQKGLAAQPRALALSYQRGLAVT